MIINYEFLGDEPIENVITCMNYKVDRVVFFCYEETQRKLKKMTEDFLHNHCGVKEVAFITLATENMKSVLETMRKEIDKESKRGNKIFFDITGGESLILVAFGMLSKEFNTPMHMYKVEKNEFININCEVHESIAKSVPKQDVKYDLSHYISMRGGSIMNKGRMQLQCEDDVYAMWRVADKYWYYWNSLSEFMRAHMIPDENLAVRVNRSTIEKKLRNSGRVLNKINKLTEILTALESEGIIHDFTCQDGMYCYKFKNSEVKSWMWKSGTILELYVYLQEKKENDDCRVSVHLDWDGVVHIEPGVDVRNEIDVLTLQGNIMTFISCKSGRLGGNQAMQAMYELETVAERFGGKYIRKVLAVAYPLTETNANRAAAMGIEVVEV